MYPKNPKYPKPGEVGLYSKLNNFSTYPPLCTHTPIRLVEVGRYVMWVGM